MTFKLQVEGLIGSTSNDAALSQWLTDGARSLVELIPPDKAEYLLVPVTVAEAGQLATGHRVFYAVAGGRPARYYSSTMGAVLADAASLHAATAFSPAWYVKDGKVFVVPWHASSQFLGLPYPTVTYSDNGTIASFPSPLIPAVAVYAAIRAKEFQIDDLIRATLLGVAFSAPSVPSKPSAPAYSYSDAAATGISAVNIGDFGAAPSFVAPSFVAATGKPNAYVPSLSPPAAPAAPSFTYTDAIAATVGSVTLPALPTPPAYTYNTDNLLPVSMGQATWTFTGINAPTVPEAPAILYADAVASAASVSVVNDLSAEMALVAGYIDTDQDIELANGKINAITQKIQKYIEETQLAVNIALQNAKNTTDVDVQNHARALEGTISAYNAVLQKYAHDLQAYQAQLSAKVNEYQIKQAGQDLDAKLALQDALNNFNRDNTVYQAGMAKIIEQARVDSSRVIEQAQLTTDVAKQNELQTLAQQIQEYQAKLDSYRTSMQGYVAQVGAEVQAYQANVGVWSREAETAISKYAQDIQLAAQEFNAGHVAYQAVIQKALEAARIAQETATQTAKTATEVSITNKARALEAAMSLYRDTLALYGQDVQIYQAQVQQEISRVSTLTQKILGQIQASAASLAELRNEYTEIVGMYLGMEKK